MAFASSAQNHEATTDSMNDLHRVLFVVVACTRDASREKAFRRLIKSLNRMHSRVGFERNLLLFDNASTIQSPLESWKAPAFFAMCSENIGYWSALKWSMDNAADLFGRRFDYIHPVESDLVLYDLEKLGEAVRFLDETATIQTVRTQEFSVASRFRYFKGGSRMIAKRRSLVADYNGVTNEKVTFEKAQGFKNIYFTNWHAKVPALHRWSALADALNKLSSRQNIDELQFMEIMQMKSDRVGLLDGGIFYALLNNPIWPWERRLLTGSWSDPEQLEAIGYRPTRRDTMGGGPVEIQIKQPADGDRQS